MDFRRRVRFRTDSGRPLRALAQGISQDVSLKGMQLLSSVAIAPRKSFELWIPLADHEVIKAKARAEWVEIEASLGDSAYWLRAGLSLQLKNTADRKRLARVIASRSEPAAEVYLSETGAKVGYVF